MGPEVDRLLSIASPPLGSPVPDLVLDSRALHVELAELLSARNGFVAFESALHVFPVDPAVAGETTLVQWNSLELWRNHYDDLGDDVLFFAEDAFGGQFAIRNEAIECLDPETGDFTRLATSIAGWAAALLADPRVLTGYPVAHQWQSQHGLLTTKQRLVPKQPFVLGGEFSVQNLYAMDAAKGMCLRGDIARQIKNLPEGASVQFRVVP
jgi:hypothetical protein